MSTTDYRRYLEETLTLTKSLVIKNLASALEINKYLEAHGHQISTDQSTWKYFLNLSGIVHFLDVPMYVSSFDTKETIEFTVSNLKLHPVTKRYYQPHTEYYKTLVEKHPEQELLIRGILNPTPLDEAINAEDYKILRWSTGLIEVQETNVIAKLQDRINNYATRWNNPAYIVSDDLYLASHLGIMYYNIPAWLMGIRLENTKTNTVHSFHIREYLKSHGRLDKHYSYLTISQALFLYRNILYIERNAGKQNTFDWLVDKIMTERGMGLAEFNLKNASDEMLLTGKKEPIFVRAPLNRYHTPRSVEEFTLEDVLYKERNIAKSNTDVMAETIETKTYSILNAKRDAFKTKILESSILDFSGSGVVILTKELLNYWLYWAAIGKYTAVFKFINPKTNKELRVNAKDAFLLFIYCYNMANGLKIDNIPKLTANMVRRNAFNLTEEEIRSKIPDKYITPEVLEAATNAVTDNSEVPYNYTFAYKVKQLHEDFYKYREIYSLQEHQMGRGAVEGIMNNLYITSDFDISGGQATFDEWLNVKGIDLAGLAEFEFSYFYEEIVKQVTGVTFINDISVAGIQKAMLEIMSQLSSYNVQYTRETNPEPILVWDWLAVRTGDIDAKMNTGLRIDILNKVAIDVGHKSAHELSLDTKIDMLQQEDKYDQHQLTLDSTIDYSTLARSVDHIRMALPRSTLTVISETIL